MRFYDKKLAIIKLNDIYKYFHSEFNNYLLSSIKKFISFITSINYIFNNSFIKKLKKQNKDKDFIFISLIYSSSKINEYDYCHKANHIKDDFYALKMKVFYEKYHSPLVSKKSKPLKSFHSIENVACYELGYSTIILYIESFIMSNSSSNI